MSDKTTFDDRGWLTIAVRYTCMIWEYDGEPDISDPRVVSYRATAGAPHIDAEGAARIFGMESLMDLTAWEVGHPRWPELREGHSVLELVWQRPRDGQWVVSAMRVVDDDRDAAYHQADLGYPREETRAALRVLVHGAAWDVPLQLVADRRDSYCRGEDADAREDIVGDIHRVQRDITAACSGGAPEVVKMLGYQRIGLVQELLDWADNHLSWEDVEAFARPAEVAVKMSDEWSVADKQIVGEV